MSWGYLGMGFGDKRESKMGPWWTRQFSRTLAYYSLVPGKTQADWGEEEELGYPGIQGKRRTEEVRKERKGNSNSERCEGERNPEIFQQQPAERSGGSDSGGASKPNADCYG